MRRALLATLMLLGASACPTDGAPTPEEPSTSDAGGSTTVEPPADGSTTGPPPATTVETGEPEAWLEAGWGISEFNAFAGTLPMVVGPQGLSMFSLPLRGKGFHNPPDPGFDDPDIPIVQAFVDVAGHAESPGGHLTEVVDYPELFYPSLADPDVLEGTAVWLVLPDTVDPSTLVGQAAHVHVELADADGLRLEDDHDLEIGQVSSAPGGP